MELTTNNIETNRIEYPKPGGGDSVRGKPLFFEFDTPLDNIESFIQSNFKGNNELNVWSNHIKLEDEHYRIDAVATQRYEGDEDVGSLVIKITPEWMRVYVKEGRLSATRVLDILETINEKRPITYIQ